MTALLIGFLLAIGAAISPSPQRLMAANDDQVSRSVREGREGVIAHTGSNTPYLAIPLGPGVKVQVCAVRCLTMVSTDAGPNRAMLRAGRIADLDIPRFEYICQCPASQGLVRGEWHLAIELPSTDTEGSAP